MGFLESLPVQRVRPVLALPLYLGTLRDHSGYGHIMVPSDANMFWRSHGAVDGVCGSGPNYLETTYAGPAMTSYTAFLSVPIRRQTTGGGFFFRNTTGLVSFQQDATRLLAYDGAFSTLITTTTGATSAAVVCEAGVQPIFYLSGAAVGVGTIALTPAWTPGDTLRIGGSPPDDPGSLFVLYPAVLTAPEILSLHNWSQDRFTPRKQWPGGGLRYPDRGDPYTPATGDPMFLDNIASARVTTADEVSGKLSNTDFVITAGTFSLDEDANGRYINCVVNGQLQYDLLGSDGFTTALFTATGTAALTKNPTNFQVDMLAGETFRALRLTA